MSKTAEQLLEAGVEIPDDPEAIAALLDEAIPPEGSDEDTDPPEPELKTTEDEPKGEDDDKGTEDEDKAKAAAEPTPATEAEPKAPHPAVIRSVREKAHRLETELGERDQSLRESQAKNAELEAELEALKAKVGQGQEDLQAQADKVVGAGNVDISALSDEKIAELRTVLDDEVVDFLAGLAKGSQQMSEQLSALQAENNELKASREDAQRQKFVETMDQVPILAVIANADGEEAATRWDRAKAYMGAVRNDPDFEDASTLERLQEVGRRMEKYLGDETVKGLLGDTPSTDQPRKQGIEDAKAAADKKAVPTSLSEIPAAGEAAAQSEAERADAMSLEDVNSLMEKTIAAGGDVDELIGKLMSSD